MVFKFFGKMLLAALAAAFVLAGGAAYATDTVALVNSRQVTFQHPRFEDASTVLILLSRPLEGSAAQMMLSETNPVRRRIISDFSTQITEFAEMDRAIAAESNPETREQLWRNRQNRLSALEGELMGSIFEEGSQAIRTVMTRRGMTVAVEADTVFYGGTDITDEVVQILNQGR